MTPREQWRPVVGYEGYYEVSDLGRVRSASRLLVDGNGPGRNRMHRGRILRTDVSKHGYLTVRLCVNKQKSHQAVHRLVVRAFLGPRPEGFEVRHLNGDQCDNRLVNLRYGTRSENIRDMLRHGTHWQANKTHCPRNHPYDEANTRVYKGGRYCLACERLNSRRRSRKKGATA